MAIKYRKLLGARAVKQADALQNRMRASPVQGVIVAMEYSNSNRCYAW